MAGGFGVFNLRLLTLLSKWWWKLIALPDFLWSRIIIGRYFERCPISVLAGRGRGYSFSIWCGNCCGSDGFLHLIRWNMVMVKWPTSVLTAGWEIRLWNNYILTLPHLLSTTHALSRSQFNGHTPRLTTRLTDQIQEPLFTNYLDQNRPTFVSNLDRPIWSFRVWWNFHHFQLLPQPLGSYLFSNCFSTSMKLHWTPLTDLHHMEYLAHPTDIIFRHRTFNKHATRSRILAHVMIKDQKVDFYRKIWAGHEILAELSALWKLKRKKQKIGKIMKKVKLADIGARSRTLAAGWI